jgi:hypothetical protein
MDAKTVIQPQAEQWQPCRQQGTRKAVEAASSSRPILQDHKMAMRGRSPLMNATAVLRCSRLPGVGFNARRSIQISATSNTASPNLSGDALSSLDSLKDSTGELAL